MERLADAASGNSLKKKALLVFVVNSSGADEVFSESHSICTEISCSLFLCVVQLYLGDLGANEVLVNSSENMLYTLYTALGSRCFTSTRHVCERSVHHSGLNWERLLHFNWIPQFEMIFKWVCKQVQTSKNCSICAMCVCVCVNIYIYILVVGRYRR